LQQLFEPNFIFQGLAQLISPDMIRSITQIDCIGMKLDDADVLRRRLRTSAR
jgi:hypothetical protein